MEQVGWSDGGTRSLSDQAILVVDIGNTSTSLGIFKRGRVCNKQFLETRLLTVPYVRECIERTLGTSMPVGAILASVAKPSVKGIWVKDIKEVTGLVPLELSHKMDIGIPISYPHPETIGADRLANAAAAAVRYGTPVIVADFGTALTFDIIDAVNGYVGGVIAPGIPLMFDYLHERTAKLPFVKPGKVKSAIGKSTEEAIRIGTQIGYQGMVKEILKRIRKDLGRRKVALCATGGYAEWILKGINEECILASDLTLYGLAQIWKNESSIH